MTISFAEGETLQVPCRHCASVSLAVQIRAGEKAIRCAKCGSETRVRIRRDAGAWSITTEKGVNGQALEAD